MEIDNTYLKYKCVQKMSSEDINRFKKIVQQYPHFPDFFRLKPTFPGINTTLL